MKGKSLSEERFCIVLYDALVCHHCTVALGNNKNNSNRIHTVPLRRGSRGAEASYLHLCASVTKQYNLVPAKGLISLAGKVTFGLVESNGSLPPGL